MSQMCSYISSVFLQVGVKPHDPKTVLALRPIKPWFFCRLSLQLLKLLLHHWGELERFPHSLNTPIFIMALCLFVLYNLWEELMIVQSWLYNSRHGQSNPIELYFKRTQSNSIELNRLSWIEFSNRTKSNSHKKQNWTIELNRTFNFRTLDFRKTCVENQ